MSGWRVRAAEPADYDAYARLMPELNVDDPIPARARWEADLLPGTLVLEQGGAVAGYSWTKVFGDAAYVFNVVVDPSVRGRGGGGALMAAVAEQARAAGAVRWSLNVKVDNVPALRLYERFGLERTYRSAALVMPWDRVRGLPRGDDGVAARAVDPSEDDAIEAAFAVIPGRFVDFRAQGRVLLVLIEGGEPVGLAAFDPALPGAFPFSVAGPALAVLLLEAMRAHARPEHAYVRLMIERDEALTDALRAAGAEVRLQLFHMKGTL